MDYGTVDMFSRLAVNRGPTALKILRLFIVFNIVSW